MFIKSSPPPPSYNTTTSTVQPNYYEHKSIPFKQKSGNTTTQNLQGTNLVQEHYKWSIQEPVEGEDPTVAMILHLAPIPNQKKRFIDFETFSSYLLNYGGTDFPSGISLCISQLSGFMTPNGIPTNVVANALPFQVGTVINAGGIIGYNVIYKNEGGVIWDITGINTLTFKVKLFGDVEARQLPAAQPLEVIAKISRVIF